MSETFRFEPHLVCKTSFRSQAVSAAQWSLIRWLKCHQRCAAKLIFGTHVLYNHLIMWVMVWLTSLYTFMPMMMWLFIIVQTLLLWFFFFLTSAVSQSVVPSQTGAKCHQKKGNVVPTQTKQVPVLLFSLKSTSGTPTEFLVSHKYLFILKIFLSGAIISINWNKNEVLSK